MCSNFFDSDAILSGNEEWTQLEEKWGEPVDLETGDDDNQPAKLRPVFSTLDLMKTTFDSSFLLKKVRRKVGRRLSKCGVLDYQEFLQDLQASSPPKQFYFVNGQIISAVSVEEICDKIDEIFKSVEKLCSATSTVRSKKVMPEIVGCSISADDLSFDDTPSEKQKTDENVDKYIDEAFENFGQLSKISIEDNVTRESVTTLVRKFSTILSNPTVNCGPRRQKKCCNKFKELAEFWKYRAFSDGANE